jgi:hypothetical protein
MEKGVVFGASVFGYHLKGGKLTVNKEEAKTVRMIFDFYLHEGMGVHLMSKELENRGIPSPSGDARWKNASILRMLKNEKYIGVLKQKKFITTDYLSHRKKINEGEEEYVIIEGNHEPIIERAVFDRVQKEIERRRAAALYKSKHSNRYVWSGKVECARCHSRFKRKIHNGKSSNSRTIWQCAEADKYGVEKINANNQKVGCNCKGVPERILEEGLLAVLDRIVDDKAQIVRELMDALRQAISTSPDNSAEMSAIAADIAKLDHRKTKLIDIFTDGSISRAEFDKVNDQYHKQMETLNDRLIALERTNQAVENLEQKFNVIDKTVEAVAFITEFSECVCREVVTKIVVENREKISFFLKNGEDNGFFYSTF